jgi:hypothetical protein
VSRLDASNVGKLSSPTATGQWHFKWHLSIAHFHVHMEMDVLHFQDSYMFFLFRISQKNLEFPGINKQSVPLTCAALLNKLAKRQADIKCSRTEMKED